jgi:hypothetical protein
MLRILKVLPVLLLGLAACSGGGGGASPSATTSAPGSVHVVVDTAAGSDSLVQFQVAAVAFERTDGTSTGNVLAGPKLVVLADPSGETDGFTLQNVPTGNYVALHLLLAPGSGMALAASGTTAAVTSVGDLTVPIAENLQHNGTGRSWLVIGHNGSAPPAVTGASVHWEPQMSGRLDGSTQTIGGLRVALVQAPNVLTQAASVDDGSLQVEFAAGCQFEDSGNNLTGGGRDDYLRGMNRGDDLSADGELHRDGRFVASRVRRGRGNDGPRLLGRIDVLRPAATSFVLHVLAEVRRGGRRLLPTPVDVLVDASTARIHASDDRRVLAFGDLQVGQLAKVEWASRTPRQGDLDLVVAREVEVTSAGMPMRPEWEGSVQSVDLGTRTIVVVPRGNDPIFVQGQSVTSVDVHVDTAITIHRQGRRGGGFSAILLDAVIAGSDRIWWRGDVTGATTIDASWVRVRDDA